MVTYRNLGFDEACDLLAERERRLGSHIIERHRDLEFEPTEEADGNQPTGLAARLLGKRIAVEPALVPRLLREFGMGPRATMMPQGVLLQALNHLVWSRLRETGGVKAWHDRDGRLLYLDWTFRQRPRCSSVSVFRSAFASIPMRNDHTVRRPAVLSLADLATRFEATVDCQKARETAPDDPSHGGVMLRHSEMGASRTALFATIYRAACWNVLVFGPSERCPIPVGRTRIPVKLGDVAGGLASRLGGLLNSIRRLARIPCLPMRLATPLLQVRWDLVQATVESLLEADDEPTNRYSGWPEVGYLYHAFNCLTWATTHRRAAIPPRDGIVLSRLSDSLLMHDSPLQRVLQADLQAVPVTRRFRVPPALRQMPHGDLRAA